VIEVEDWAEIRRLHRAEGLPIKQIARIKSVSRNTVRAALRSDGPPTYEREPKGSVADGFEPRIRELLMAYPAIPASVIGGADRVAVFGPDAAHQGRGAAAGVLAATCSPQPTCSVRRYWTRTRPGWNSARRRASGSS